MGSYLETVYFRDELGENDYPNRLCRQLISAYLEPHASVAGKSILDIGCGKGNHLFNFRRAGMEPFGIDRLEESVGIVEGVDIRKCNLETEAIPHEEGVFDFVFTKSVIEHVANTENFLQESYRVLKPGGMLLVMTPDWSTHYKYFYDDYTHVKPWTRKGLQNALTLFDFAESRCEFFYQLPYVWKYPWLDWWPGLVAALVPDRFKWKNKEESDFRAWVRFAKERMLVATAIKPKE